MKSKYSVGLIAAILVVVAPAVTLAAFKPLVGIPGVDGNADFNTYINALYALSISLAALLAVIKIIIAGVKWMLSDVVTSKQQAKSDMQGALLGLLIVIAAVLILNTINPQLTQTSLFVGPVDKIPGILAGGGGGGAAPAGGVLPKAQTQDCLVDVDPASGVSSFDCSAVSNACKTSGGKVLPYNNWMGVQAAGKITCSYGNEVATNCTSTTDPADPWAAPTYDCTAEEASCAKKGGSIVDKNASSFTCIIPY